MAAGLVIHALAAEQDMRKMGGLRRLMPRTYWAFLIGTLALVGVFPFAGFFSKDPVVGAAMARGGGFGYALWAVALAGAFLTGLYAFRMLFLVFGGEPSPFAREHFHALEGDVVGVSMAATVGILAVLSTLGGWIQWTPYWDPVDTWLAPVAEPLVTPTNAQEWISSGLTLTLGVAGIVVAWLLYSARRVAVPRLPAWQRALEHKLWFDEAYYAVFYRPASAFAHALTGSFERPVILGFGREIGEETKDLGGVFARLQTGLVRTYALAIATSLAVLAIVFVVVK
jgi:NADH-quinone oxidoreductase subunit L